MNELSRYQRSFFVGLVILLMSLLAFIEASDQRSSFSLSAPLKIFKS